MELELRVISDSHPHLPRYVKMGMTLQRSFGALVLCLVSNSLVFAVGIGSVIIPNYLPPDVRIQRYYFPRSYRRFGHYASSVWRPRLEYSYPRFFSCLVVYPLGKAHTKTPVMHGYSVSRERESGHTNTLPVCTLSSSRRSDFWPRIWSTISEG